MISKEMTPRGLTSRRLTNILASILSAASALVGLIFLTWILFVVLSKGASSLSLAFFTKLPTPPGMEGGGLANAIVGSVIMTFLGTMVGVPLGLCTGVFLAEFGRGSWLSDLVRFSANMLMGMPSIIIGVFVYGLMVTTMGGFSGLAGAMSLAILILPIVAKTTDDILHLVPNALREAGLALGIPRWRVVNSIIFRAARTGLLTGVLLAVARVSGETAPLLFTALNSPYWPDSLSKPMANLTVTIFNYAMSPYENWQQMAWGASFLILLSVLGLTLVSRVILGSKK